MCTALFFYDIHPTILFLLAFNREEYQERCGLGAYLHACALERYCRLEGLAYPPGLAGLGRADLSAH